MTGTGVTALQPLRPGSATVPYRPAAAATWVRHRRSTVLQPLRPGSATAAVERQEVLIAEVDVV